MPDESPESSPSPGSRLGDDDIEDVEVTQPEGTEDVETSLFATEDDIDETIAEREVFLPVMRKMVYVRILEGPEAASLEYLPDVVGYAKLIAKAGEQAQEPDPDRRLGVDEVEFAEQNAIYLAAVAHRAVRHPEASKEPVRCPDCANREHVRSLWTLAKTRRLHQVDVSVIVDVALSAGVSRELRPFSTAGTPDASSEPATSGA